MNELDAAWSKMLADALVNAKSAGRGDVADYLALKATNDQIRQTAVKWLFESLLEIAGEANRQNSSISIERQDPHNFAHMGANMAGSMLRVRQGVRCLTLEAGWTRTPGDGFMRGGALAAAKITHFGMAKSTMQISLTTVNNSPVWKILKEDKATDDFNSGHLISHFRLFIGE